MHIWERGTALLSEDPVPNLSRLYESPYSYLAYFRCVLVLTGNENGAQDLLLDCIRRVKENTSDRCEMLSFAIPLALEAYLRYTGDIIQVKKLLPQVEQILSVEVSEETILTSTFEYASLLLGAVLSMHRLQATCGCDIDYTRQTRLSLRFHERFFREKDGCYTDDRGKISPVTAVLPNALGFAHADAHRSARRILIEESFAVPRVMRLFLYDAMISEELYDLLLPTLLEGGAPRGTVTYADLAGLVCIPEHLLGVDLAMLGKGIRCFTPHLPDQIAYRAILPAGKGFLTFESEEQFFESFD